MLYFTTLMILKFFFFFFFPGEREEITITTDVCLYVWSLYMYIPFLVSGNILVREGGWRGRNVRMDTGNT